MVQLGWDVTGTTNFILTIILSVLIYCFLFYVLLKIIRRKTSFIVVSIGCTLTILSTIIYMPLLFILTNLIIAVFLILVLFANMGDVRKFVANPFRVEKSKIKNFGVEKLYDHDALYKNIEEAILILSKTKTGALITFEKNTSLNDFMKNGVSIMAPVTSELLLTIFYPGTRLHDGAVVIHDNMIIAASVFYTPSTKAFADKFGSRHRAALGISEVCDAITVVVSEETGRISFAVNGELESVEPSNFRKALETYLASPDD